MLHLPLLLIAAGGAALVGRKKRRQTAAKAQAQTAQSATSNAGGSLQTQVRRLANQVVRPLLGTERERQFAELQAAGGSRGSVSEAEADEKQAQLRAGVSMVTLGVTAGGLLFPPLTLLSLPGLAYTTIPYLKKGYQDLKAKRRPTASTLDLVLVPGVLLLGDFFAVALTTTVLAVAHLLVLNMEDRSTRSVVDVYGKQPMKVWILAQGNEVEIPFARLAAGDLLVAGAGQMIAADGEIVEGAASIDQRLMTGESQPVEKSVGDGVMAATLVLAGRIVVKVERTGEETLAAKIAGILARTAAYKQTVEAKSTAVGDRWAAPTLGLAAVATPLRGVRSGLALLLSSPGYDLRILGPLNMLSFLKIAAENGVLIKDAQALERLSSIDAIVFDKTGTLTLEQPRVCHIHSHDGWQQKDVLRFAAAAEQRQAHPIARAITLAAQKQRLELPALSGARYELGFGIKVTSGDLVFRVGSARFLANEGIPLPQAAADLQESAHRQGRSLVMVGAGDAFVGAIELEPAVRPEARELVAHLRNGSRKLYIFSGDHEHPTRALAQSLGVDRYFANTLPEQKAGLVKQLQAEGRKVCFVGDGINDAIALQQADVSVSLRGAATLATDTAQIVLMGGSLRQLDGLFSIGRRYDGTMRNSHVISFAPSLATVGGVVFLHIGVTSALTIYSLGLIAGLANSLSPSARGIGSERSQVQPYPAKPSEPLTRGSDEFELATRDSG